MSVIDWLLEGDPAIRWQVLRDLTHASVDEVAAERARVEHDGWGARLLALEDPDGLWDGGACFPASYTGSEPGQPWTATMHTLQTVQFLGSLTAAGTAKSRTARCGPPSTRRSTSSTACSSSSARPAGPRRCARPAGAV